MDWVEVYESHTPYEWRVQQILAVIDPWGDDRADLRAAHTTLWSTPGEFDRDEAFDQLRNYLAINENND